MVALAQYGVLGAREGLSGYDTMRTVFSSLGAAFIILIGLWFFISARPSLNDPGVALPYRAGFLVVALAVGGFLIAVAVKASKGEYIAILD